MTMTETNFTEDLKLSLDDTGEEQTTRETFDSYVRHMKADMDSGAYLGFLGWYHVPQACNTTYDDYLQMIEDSGAPIHVAAAPKPTNVFRRGCTQVQRGHRKVSSGKSDIFFNYLIIETGKDDDKIYRKVIRQEVDHGDHELEFVELGDMTFVRETGHIKSVASPEGIIDPRFGEIITEVRAFVKDNAFTVTAYTIRESIRKALEGNVVKGVRVNPNGGVYFVSRIKSEVLAQIEHLCDMLEGITFSIIPQIDDGKQRELLRSAFQDESVGALQELSAQAIELAEGDAGITEDRWVKLSVAYQDQKARVDEFSALLNDALGESRVSLTVCGQQIDNLRKKVK